MGQTIKSAEWETRQRGRHGTQVLCDDGGWYFVSEFPESRHIRQQEGVEIYQLEWDLESSDEIRAYHRSNAGLVYTLPGMQCLGPLGEDSPLPL